MEVCVARFSDEQLCMMIAVLTVYEDTKRCIIHVKYDEPPLEALKLDAKKIVIVYELRSNDFYVPALSVATSVQIEAYDWSRQVSTVFAK
jgi:hypothetical protein